MQLRDLLFGLMCLGLTSSLYGCAEDSDSSDDGTALELAGGTAGASAQGMGGMSETVNPEGGAAGNGDGNGNGNGMTPDPSGGSADCDTAGFTAAEEVAGNTQYGLAYQASAPSSSGGDAQDVMLTQIYSSFGGPTEPGRYDLAGINFKDCGLCLLIQTNCSENAPCEKTFYAEEGIVEITAIGGDRFAAVYENVVYREVTITEGESVSTPVPGGESWCANGYEFDQMLQAGNSGGGESNEEVCAGPVACLGEEIANFSLKSCETNQNVAVRDYFEGAQAAVFLGTAGWCPACSQRIPQLVAEEGRRPGLKVMYVLGEDRGYNEPTQAYCENYARSHDVPISQIFIDHDGEYGHANFFTNIWPYPVNQMLGLPYHAVMDPSDWTYVYGDGGPVGDFNSALNSLLQ